MVNVLSTCVTITMFLFEGATYNRISTEADFFNRPEGCIAQTEANAILFEDFIAKGRVSLIAFDLITGERMMRVGNTEEFERVYNEGLR